MFAVGGAGRSEWTDEGSNARLFDSIDPAPDSHTQIGEICVNQVGGNTEPGAGDTQAAEDEAEVAPTSMSPLCGAGGPMALLAIVVGLLELRFAPRSHPHKDREP